MEESQRERAEYYTARRRRRRRGCLAALLVPVLLVVGVGVWLGMRMLAEPTISRNFTAEFNARYDGVPESDKAWPLYKQAILFGYEHQMPEKLLYYTPALPNWSVWGEYTAWLKEMAPALALMREGAQKPVLGKPMSNIGDQDIARAQAGALGLVFNEETAVENPSLAESIDPVTYGHFRRMAQALSPDVYLAIEEGDTDRAVRDIEAMLGIAVHTGESESLIGLLIRIALDDYTARTMTLALSQYPDAFSAGELARLQEAFRTIGCAEPPPAGVLVHVTPSLSMERAFFLDMVQRAYSDNGSGDGYLTLQGAMNAELQTLPTTTGPAAFIMSPSRKDLVARHKELMDLAQAAINGSGADRRASMDRLNAAVTALNAGWISRSRNVFLTSLIPVLPRLIRAVEMSEFKRGAVIAKLALFRYRLDHGAFPGTLGALVPEYIPALPIDPVDGKPLRYRLGPDGPVLYSLGADADDDGGLRGGDEAGAYPTRSGFTNGDWVLYPKPFEDEPGYSFPGSDEEEPETSPDGTDTDSGG